MRRDVEEALEIPRGARSLEPRERSGRDASGRPFGAWTIGERARRSGRQGQCSRAAAFRIRLRSGTTDHCAAEIAGDLSISTGWTHAHDAAGHRELLPIDRGEVQVGIQSPFLDVLLCGHAATEAGIAYRRLWLIGHGASINAERKGRLPLARIFPNLVAARGTYS
jgi:hypothetical protein